MSKATNDQMDSLHGALASHLTEAIKHPGEGGVSASLLKEAREFLKDNNVSADIAKNKPLQALTDTLPFKDELTGT